MSQSCRTLHYIPYLLFLPPIVRLLRIPLHQHPYCQLCSICSILLLAAFSVLSLNRR
uniref:Uncharacterized protein n=1 Tax=Rhizophora mucronata TaxID=61149 RepID=A0A2P2M0P7_RHIMU